MKYGIWRHENALGNSAEQTVNLNDFIIKSGDDDPHIYVETEFQKDFALCIQGITEDRVHFFDQSLPLAQLNKNTHLVKDIYMPDVYFGGGKCYPSTWQYLADIEHKLIFPEDTYENKHDLPKGAIVMSIRESGTYNKRVDGSMCEPNRFVNPNTFFELSKILANEGYTVIRIGDKNQKPMPDHKNIFDFAKVENRRMLDDLFLINHAAVFLSCDSGIWPISGGLKTPLILSNVTSVFNSNPPKMSIVDWLPKETSKVLFKSNGREDNSLEELLENVRNFL